VTLAIFRKMVECSHRTHTPQVKIRRQVESLEPSRRTFNMLKEPHHDEP
jgi:hypothetical protein